MHARPEGLLEQKNLNCVVGLVLHYDVSALLVDTMVVRYLKQSGGHCGLG